MKKLLSLALVCLLALSLCACGGDVKSSGVSGNQTQKDPYEGLSTYMTQAGDLSIRLPYGWKDMSNYVEGFDFCFSSEDESVLLVGVKDTPDIIRQAGYDTSSLTLKGYGDIIADLYGFDGNFQEDSYGNLYYEYSYYSDDVQYSAYNFIKNMGYDAYWCLNFLCEASDYDSLVEDFRLWASSIELY